MCTLSIACKKTKPDLLVPCLSFAAIWPPLLAGTVELKTGSRTKCYLLVSLIMESRFFKASARTKMFQIDSAVVGASSACLSKLSDFDVAHSFILCAVPSSLLLVLCLVKTCLLTTMAPFSTYLPA
uniref:Secreted protein n=1 Tax=Panagrellus redivivus TaxID=6233 RepID=A0A7E4W5I7_PANRE